MLAIQEERLAASPTHLNPCIAKLKLKRETTIDRVDCPLPKIAYKIHSPQKGKKWELESFGLRQH